jgi:hypothetical protein
MLAFLKVSSGEGFSDSKISPKRKLFYPKTGRQPKAFSKVVQ